MTASTKFKSLSAQASLALSKETRAPPLSKIQKQVVASHRESCLVSAALDTSAARWRKSSKALASSRRRLRLLNAIRLSLSRIENSLSLLTLTSIRLPPKKSQIRI